MPQCDNCWLVFQQESLQTIYNVGRSDSYEVCDQCYNEIVESKFKNLYKKKPIEVSDPITAIVDFWSVALGMRKAEEEDFDVSRKLPDEGNYINRIEIKSKSSNRLYVVAQDKDTLEWKCSCPGWTVKKAGKERTCTHLKEMGLTKKNPFLGKYKTQDGPPGSPSDWKKAAEGLVPEMEVPKELTTSTEKKRKLNLDDL